MLWIVLILLALAVAGMLYQASLSPEERAPLGQDRERRQRERRRADAAPPPRDAVLEEVERDPVHALARYGTPEDAERLIAQGVDLEALGYRPPDQG